MILRQYEIRFRDYLGNIYDYPLICRWIVLPGYILMAVNIPTAIDHPEASLLLIITLSRCGVGDNGYLSCPMCRQVNLAPVVVSTHLKPIASRIQKERAALIFSTLNLTCEAGAERENFMSNYSAL